MPIREFIDAAGIPWQVWSTIPYTTGVAGTLQRGWLTFESAAERRRLAPIPLDWENATIAELREFCAKAERTMRTPHSGTWPVEQRDP